MLQGCPKQVARPPGEGEHSLMWPIRQGSTPYNGLYGEAPPGRGTFSRLEVNKRVGISRVEVIGIKRDFQNILNRRT